MNLMIWRFDNLMMLFKTALPNPVNPSNPSIRGQTFSKAHAAAAPPERFVPAQRRFVTIGRLFFPLAAGRPGAAR